MVNIDSINSRYPTYVRFKSFGTGPASRSLLAWKFENAGIPLVFDALADLVTIIRARNSEGLIE